MGDEFHQAICDARHEEMGRRVGELERAVHMVIDRLDKVTAALAAQGVWSTVGKLSAGSVIGAAVTLIAKHFVG